eukprot:m.80810 g.80810  ORF g.80810 m.80810 type:complete len:52 (+) comp12032_c0_seq7:38-193(+)
MRTYQEDFSNKNLHITRTTITTIQTLQYSLRAGPPKQAPAAIRGYPCFATV